MAKQSDDVQRPSADNFWSEQGRKKWPQISEVKIFLGQATIELGELLFGREWSGKSSRPKDDEFVEIQNRIASAAADERIKIYALDPETREYNEVPASEWRIPSLLGARFSRCSINCHNPRDPLAVSKNHGYMFVDRQAFSDLKTSILPKISNDEIARLLPQKQVSMFLMFMLHYICSKNMSEDELPGAKILARDLQREWQTWRLQIAGKNASGKLDPLTGRMASSMSTILRGETARKEKMSTRKA